MIQYFQDLTGFPPMDWQTRLFTEYLRGGRLPAALDVPTGLGKTAIMALWLLARASGAPLPRRLVYVVDRRAVVDQATEFAEQLRHNLDACSNLRQALGLEGSLPISTLRGDFVDNRQWLDDPSGAAVIVGTVDMVGSRLLFEGYGVSRKLRPYQAGLLGADSLVVLDESHLVPPFERLLETIEGDTGQFGCCKPVPPFRLLSLSATGRKRAGEVFTLMPEDHSRDRMAVQRLHAAKSLHLRPAGADDVEEALAREAWDLTGSGKDSIRCLVFCDRRESAQKVVEKLSSRGAPRSRIELLVGARRVRERDLVADRLRELGFWAGSAGSDGPAFLVATSAGEVGVDLDADHMACDLVAWERMVQRLGRVNRRGERPARIHALVPERKSEWTDPVLAVIQHGLTSTPDGGYNVSPLALGAMRESVPDLVARATTPEPLRPELTRAVVDAWSLTSLLEHPGRPEVEPWLRGWVQDEPQTSVAWRAHLPIREGQETRQALKQAEAFFQAAPVHASELLETETSRVLKWLSARVAKHHPKGVYAFLLNRAGEVTELLDPSTNLKELKDTLVGQTLVVDARLAGLQQGLLHEGSVESIPSTADDDLKWAQVVGFTVRLDHEPPQSGNGRERFRFATQLSDDGAELEWLVVESWHEARETEDDRSTRPDFQTLVAHQDLAARKAERLALRLGLEGPWAELLIWAARLHDEGKRAPRWQRAFRARPDQAYAKTPGPINQKLLDGYRHELGTLIRVEKEALRLPEEVQDLALHLIAAHHGYARPLLPLDGCDDAPPSTLHPLTLEAAMRFARLQQRWGPWGLAWWESLLRAADQQASREQSVVGELEVALRG